MTEAGHGRHRVLVVEDSRTQLEELRFLLEQDGYQVETAANGAQGLEAARNNDVSLVVSDVVMPEMDGFELCEALRADPELNRLPVILLTSLGDPRDVIRGLESGANNFICKPYEAYALRERIKTVLANQEIRRTASTEMGISIFFLGQRFFIAADRLQILDLLLSTYENAVSQNTELRRVRDELCALNEQLEARVVERTAALESEVEERTNAQKRLKHLNAVLRASRHVNQLIVREKEPQQLTAKTCELLVKTRGYDGAWMALEGPAESISNWAQCGWDDVFQPLARSLEQGEWPPCREISSRSAGAVAIDEKRVCSTCSLGASDDGSNCTVSALRHGDRIWGMLGISCHGQDATDEEELGLVDEVSRDIALALANIAGEEERKRAEEEKRRLQAALAQSDRLASMGMLAAGVAHEINNPLTYVLYNLESLSEEIPRHAHLLDIVRKRLHAQLGEAATRDLLRDSAESLRPEAWAQIGERFRDALSGSERIKEIARGLKVFARVEQDQRISVDLSYPIESALRIAFNEIKYRARLEKELTATAPVLGSPGKLSQVFLNLFLNAAHAIHEGDVENNRIRVRTWQEGGVVCAEVQDTGSGIPAEDLDRVFEPFFTTKGVGVGSGLGLSIVQNLVSGFGGTIEVSSEVGGGTSFLIRLPAAAAAAAAEAEESVVSTSETPAVKGRILVVDDEAAIRVALKRICAGHEVVTVDSGDKAMEILRSDRRFDVVLCDMMMPATSGMDLHRWVLGVDPSLARRVVFVTGGAFTPDAREYLSQVDNLRVDKPFDVINLRKMIAEWVRAGRSERD